MSHTSTVAPCYDAEDLSSDIRECQKCATEDTEVGGYKCVTLLLQARVVERICDMCFTLCLTGISGNKCACKQRRATTYRKRPCFSLGRQGGGHESKESVFVM